ncbi:Type 1 glutamine amidotransferase-like domain-containing protein [Streptomyces sp. NPDC004532]|uniref:Type 1 glutamine amidotransferase-like domain-containing protein n=1 Tax=Streptomyces sp. NPDC052207 TaxID=3155418 RepID=UPI00343D9AFF
MLKKLHARALRIIGERVRCDVHYVGSSAATNMACPTLHATNGMPIVETSTFQALGSVPLQITLATSNTVGDG